jgi:hypothetical protein
MSYNYIQSPYATEKSSRLYISQMFRTIYSIINKILKEAETEIVESKYDQQIKENIIETSKVRIDNLLSRFQDIIIQFNSKFTNQIEISNETFSHIDKLEYLSKLQPTAPSEIDVNAVD